MSIIKYKIIKQQDGKVLTLGQKSVYDYMSTPEYRQTIGREYYANPVRRLINKKKLDTEQQNRMSNIITTPIIDSSANMYKNNTIYAGLNDYGTVAHETVHAATDGINNVGPRAQRISNRWLKNYNDNPQPEAIGINAFKKYYTKPEEIQARTISSKLFPTDNSNVETNNLVLSPRQLKKANRIYKSGGSLTQLINYKK